MLYFIFLFPSWGQNFNFALITDIHITKDSISFNDLQRSVAQINSTQGLRFVIVSGDITDNGDEESLLKAKLVLDKLKIDYHIVSGNHESKWSESGAMDFSRIFGSERFKFEYDGVWFLGFPTGPVIRMADGHVAPQDITWLKQSLSEIGKKKPVVLVTHYPLLDGDVDNWYEVTDAVRPYNICTFLGGHYHKNSYLTYDGIPGITNRSNLRGKDKVGGYSIYEFRQDSVLVYEQKIGEKAVKWIGISMTKDYYTADNSSCNRPDFGVNKEYSNVTDIWTVEIGNGIYSSPVVYNNKVYIGDDLGHLSCLSLLDGKKEWNYKVGSRIIGTPAASEGIIVFGSVDKNIYGLDSEKGRLLWKYSTNAAVMGAVVIENGIAYIGSSDHVFRAIDIKNGQIVWEYNGIKGYVETRPLLYDDKVIFGAWDDNLYALNKKTGKLEWIWNNNFSRMHFSPAAVWPVAANNKVFIADPERAMTAIDIKTGKTIWRTKQSMVRETIGLSEDGAKVYSKTMQDSLVCYSTDGNIPREIWASNVDFGYEHAPSMPVEKDGTVFGSTKNGLIFAVDARDGKVLWKHKVGNTLINTVVPINEKRCVYTSSSGVVGLLEF